MFAVHTEALRKEFTLKKGLFDCRKAVAVDNVSLTVKEGQAVAFIGPNGAGKSTTIKMLTGILQPTSGKAQVLGLDPWRQRSRLVRQIGAVFGQRSQLWLHLPPKDSFELLAEIYSLDKKSKAYKARLEMLIERFELAAFLNTPVRKLSLGERMRAEIAASLLHRPRLLLLDEPTIGIDVVARQRLRELLAQWNREEGLTVFLTSHDTGDIEAVADRVILINHGRVIIDDTIDGVRHYGTPKGSQSAGDLSETPTIPALEKVLSDLFTAK